MPAACSKPSKDGEKPHESGIDSINMDVGGEYESSIAANAVNVTAPCDNLNPTGSKRRRSGDVSQKMKLNQELARVGQDSDTPKTKFALVSRTRELTSEDLNELLCQLYPRLDKILHANFIPKFCGRGISSGRIWFECMDMESRCWMEKQVKEISNAWSRGSFDVVEWVPAPPLQRVCVSIPWLVDERTPAQLVVSRLDSLNPHLGVKRWTLFKAAKPWEGKRLFIFGLDDEALDLLEHNEFELFYAFNKLTAFKYTNRK